MSATTSCVPCCTTPQVTNTPGSQGLDGSDGTNGINAFSLTTNDFVVPAIGSTVGIAVDNSGWMVVGQNIVTAGPANFVVTAVPSTTSATIQFLGYPGDVNVGSTVLSGSVVSPAGQRGGSTLHLTNTAVNLTLGPFNDVVIVTADNKTITLPTAVGIAGKEYTVIQTAAFTSGTTINTTGGQTINGSATATLGAQYKFKVFVSDGANWFIVGAN